MERKMTKKRESLKFAPTMESKTVDQLYKRISEYIHTARQNVVRSIDIEQVNAYWLMGRDLVEYEQKGQKRAAYGKGLLKQISAKLNKEFGRGFSVDILEQCRKFYLAYTSEPGLQHKNEENRKSDTACRKLKAPAPPRFNSDLSWSHYRHLMREMRPEVRSFYTIEAIKNNWSSHQLARQMNSFLYERLAKSRDKKGLIALANKGHEINVPEDAIKEPIVLEFLGIPESHKLVETKLEEALITHLQNFLLEMGKGFAFVARQKRITLDGDHFYPDLIFYHTILKCYTIIELKTGKLTHEDLGQMQLYVNYFDKEIATKEDNPTIGLILCAEKNKIGTTSKFLPNNRFGVEYHF